MNEPHWHENRDGAEESGGERLEALKARLERLGSTVAAFDFELSSVREQLASAGWKRTAAQPAAPIVQASAVEGSHPGAVAGAPIPVWAMQLGFPAAIAPGPAERGGSDPAVAARTVSFAYQKDWLGLREAVTSDEIMPVAEAQA